MKRMIALLMICLLPSSKLLAQTTQPHIARENIEWLDVWLADTTVKDNLPRVLLIGDSITRAYYPQVQLLLKGKAHVSRLATSKSVGDPLLLEQIKLVLAEQHFDVIHFNNGMHGWDYSEDEYRAAFPDFLSTIKAGAPNAKLIWATTTPVRDPADINKFTDRTERVKVRNQIAASLIEPLKIPTDDLFSVVKDHAEFYSPKDGVHFNPDGVAAEAKSVADAIAQQLK